MNQSKDKKSYGNKAGYTIFRWTITHFGVGPAYFILIFPIAYYVLCRPSAYRNAGHYLRRRFPNSPWWKRLWYTYKYFYTFGLCLIDQAAISILGPETFKIEFFGADELKKLAEEGRGIVLLTSHIGIWQQAISTLGFMDRSTYLNIRREYHSETMGLADFNVPGVDIHIISPDNFLGGVPELSTALLRGNLAALMGDRVYDLGTGKGTGACVDVNFLGDAALFPLLPHQLALSTGSDVVVFLTTRTGRQRFHFEAKIKRITKDIQELAKDEGRTLLLKWYVHILEDYVTRHPFMWYNFFNFWKK